MMPTTTTTTTTTTSDATGNVTTVTTTVTGPSAASATPAQKRCYPIGTPVSTPASISRPLSVSRKLLRVAASAREGVWDFWSGTQHRSTVH